MKRCTYLTLLVLFVFNGAFAAVEIRPMKPRTRPLIFDGGLAEHEIALTFGGAIKPEVTNQILDMLKREDLKAHFFVSGISASKNPEIVKRIVSEGHILGSGGYGKSLATEEDTTPELKAQKLEEEIIIGHEMVFSVAGVIYPFIRILPDRDTLQIRQFMQRSNVFAFYWTIDHEWDNPAATLSESLKNEDYRGIVSISLGRPESIAALKQLFIEIKHSDLRVIVLAPPKKMDWKTKPPLIRGKLLDYIENNGSFTDKKKSGYGI